MNIKEIAADPLVLIKRIARYLHTAKRQFEVEHMRIEDGFNALDFLETTLPDKGTSCICHNHIFPYYDLQVIIPVYNVEKYVEQAIDSVLNQVTRYRFLTTIINDGSTDTSRKKLEKYVNLAHVEIIDQKNRGFSGARNTGLQNIRGKYLTFVDSDDFLPPNAIEKLMSKAFELNADIVEGSYAYFYKTTILEICRNRDAQNLKSLRGFPWGKVIRSSLFSNLKFPENYWFEDTLYAFILFKQTSNMASISDVVYHWRKNYTGITSSCIGKTKAIDTLYVTRKLLKDCELLGIDKQSTYETFLNQLRSNYQRTLLLPDKRIVYAIFLETVRLRKTYFNGLKTDNVSNKTIEAALEHNDFKLYAKTLKS